MFTVYATAPKTRAMSCPIWPATDVICAGFAARHGDDCTPVQIVRRLEAMAGAA